MPHRNALGESGAHATFMLETLSSEVARLTIAVLARWKLASRPVNLETNVLPGALGLCALVACKRESARARISRRRAPARVEDKMHAVSCIFLLC